MATATLASPIALPPPILPEHWSLENLQEHLGGIPFHRIRLYPPPGFATKQHLLEVAVQDQRIYELVDGILVAKAMGAYESILAGVLIQLLRNFLDENPLGTILAPDGLLEILPNLVRGPDVSFARWERFPAGSLQSMPPNPVVVPDLAVEVLSRSNTAREMERKRKEYFRAGVKLVWMVDPPTRSAQVFTSESEFTSLAPDGSLDGGDVLPGFRLSLAELFSRADKRP